MNKEQVAARLIAHGCQSAIHRTFSCKDLYFKLYSLAKKMVFLRDLKLTTLNIPEGRPHTQWLC